MSALATLENALAAHVLHADPAIEDEVLGTTRVPTGVRLGIYRDAYVLRIIEALDTDFPGVHALAGDEGWAALTRAYIAAHPSHHFSLRVFGQHLAGFLREESPVLAEMAAFEWALSNAFDAADSVPVTVAEVAAIPPQAWTDLRFEFHPSVQRLDLDWNVPAIWNAIKANEPIPAPERSESALAWLVWRKGLGSYFRSLDPLEKIALDAARDSHTFAELCETLATAMTIEATPAHAASLLKRWIEDEIVSGLCARGPESG